MKIHREKESEIPLRETRTQTGDSRFSRVTETWIRTFPKHKQVALRRCITETEIPMTLGARIISKLLGIKPPKNRNINVALYREIRGQERW